ncbi:MAG: hypothetical protein QM644_07885 [Mobilitalea sp.]
MSNNIFKKEKQSIIPFIVVGVVLIIAIICVTIYSKSKQTKKDAYEPFDITSDMVTIPAGDPYTVEPEQETLEASVTNENIGDYAESVIEGSDLNYLLSTMDDTYAYLISSESINRMESVVIGDYVTTAYVETDGMYTSRLTEDSATGGMHDEIFLNVGHTIDGISSIRWDDANRAFYTSGILRIADVAKIIYDPETDERYKDIFVQMFVPWDHRGAFKDNDQFYVRKLFSTEEDSLIGYVFEQTAIQFVGDSSLEDVNAEEGSNN